MDSKCDQAEDGLLGKPVNHLKIKIWPRKASFLKGISILKIMKSYNVEKIGDKKMSKAQ